MWIALLYKEMRECSVYAGLALFAQMAFLGAGMDLPLLPFWIAGRGLEIPFASVNGTGREALFTMTIVIVAIVLGLHQTLWESWRQTTLFLLHRPMPRSQIFLGKIAAGLLLLTAVSALPLLVYSLWAATPGTHASPFFWGMTDSWWRSVAIGFISYLGAFLTGLRPARWLGSRTWPMIAAVVMSFCLKFMPIWMSVIYLGFAVLIIGYMYSILETARVREFP